MELHAIRHTTPLVEKGRCYGHADVPLAHTFEQEFEELLERLPAQIDLVFTSPLTRCRVLASRISDTFAVDDRLIELNFGEWEMSYWDNIDPVALNKWMSNFCTESCPGGESYTDLIARVRLFVEDLRLIKHDSIVVVTHGGVIRALNTIFHEVSPADSMNIAVPYGSLTTFVVTQ
jgi:alpha-ribazole phosphatase